jgi:outer membrane receptor protein involved in Fe transport
MAYPSFMEVWWGDFLRPQKQNLAYLHTGCGLNFIHFMNNFSHRFFLYILLCLIPFAAQANRSLIVQILDGENSQTIAGASVSIRSLKLILQTNENGEVDFKDVPNGNYDLSVSMVGYTTQKFKITFSEAVTAPFVLNIFPSEVNLSEVIISGRLNKETEYSSRYSEKTADNVLNVISARTIEKSPDINAANVLQRLSGISIQRSNGGTDSYTVIRGMEPRYNNTLINGIKIASPNEKSRFVPLDIIPSDLLQRIEVSKTLRPDMEADAIGGTVNLIMKDAPDTTTLKAVASVGYNQIFIDSKYTQFDQSVIQKKSLYSRYGADYVARPEDFSRKNLAFKGVRAAPNFTGGLTLGNRYFHRKLGALISLNVQNQYSGAESAFNTIANNIGNVLQKVDVANRTYATQQLNVGLVTHLDFVLNPNNKFSLSNVWLMSKMDQARLSIDTALLGDGRTGPGTGFVNVVYRSIENRQIVENLKLEGKHVLQPKLLVDWSTAISFASKVAPDRAELVTDFKIGSDFKRTATFFDRISRIWQHNEDRDYSANANLTYYAHLFGNAVQWKAGGMFRYKTRFNHADQYILKPTIDTITGQKQIFQNIETAQWTVYNPRGTAEYDVNNYTAHEEVGAGYLQGKMDWGRMQVLAGARVEFTGQAYKIKTITTTQANAVNIFYTDFLPGIHFKYRINGLQNLRFSYFKSIARPGYYELVPYKINGSEFDEVGNPYLKHTKADNLDVRYELYSNKEDQILLGGFYKWINKPIEFGLTGLSSGQIIYTPNNFGNAINRGFELVLVKYFGAFGVTGNYTFTASNIASKKAFNDSLLQQTRFILVNRPLQGQSRHIANLSFIYRNSVKGLYAQMAFEYIGRTLKEVSADFGGDYYQKRQFILGISAEKRFGRHWILFGKFNNLLNTPTILETKNGLLVQRNIYKASYQIGVSFTH